MDNIDYVSYEQAIKLKESGFDWPCYHFYQSEKNGIGGYKLRRNCSKGNLNKLDRDPDYFIKCGYIYSAPTLWEAQKWLREKHSIFIEVSFYSGRELSPCGIKTKDFHFYSFELYNISNGLSLSLNTDYQDEDYNTCLSAGISAALELIGKEAEGE